jgi:hypothetical protein
MAGNSMAYDSIGSIASALSGYSLTLVETRRACPGLVSWLRPGIPGRQRRAIANGGFQAR